MVCGRVFDTTHVVHNVRGWRSSIPSCNTLSSDQGSCLVASTVDTSGQANPLFVSDGESGWAGSGASLISLKSLLTGLESSPLNSAVEDSEPSCELLAAEEGVKFEAGPLVKLRGDAPSAVSFSGATAMLPHENSQQK